EDTAYRELGFGGDDIPSIKSLDTHNEFVVHTSTFSKPCSAGLKTGFAMVPRDLKAPLLRLKGNHDFGSANFNQHLLNQLIESGAYNRHVAEVRRVYQRKAQVITDALAAEFREWPAVRWTKPAGGMYVWMSFPGQVSTGPESALMRAAVREGV